jgi:type III secretory pathway component EscT
MKAIQLGVAIAFVVGVLMFVMKGGAAGSITDEIMRGQDTSQELSTELHDEIQISKDSLSKRIRKLRFPEATY